MGVLYETMAWFGVVLGYIGIMLVFYNVLPTQLKESLKQDGLRNTRLALPALTSLLLVLYIPTLMLFTSRLLSSYDYGFVTNAFRGFISLSIFITGVLLTVIYRYGGNPNDN